MEYGELKSKLKLVYDITILKSAFNPNELRNGVFFVTLNVLRQLLGRHDVDLTLTCNSSDFYCVKYVLDREIPQTQFNFKVNGISKFFSKLKYLKKSASRDNRKIKRSLFRFLEAIFFPLFKLSSFFVTKHDFCEYDAFLSSAYSISKEVKAKKYIVLHDLIPLILPGYQDNWRQGKWLYDLCETLNHDDHYFANSEYTRKDFLKYYPKIDPKKIKTTLLACDAKFRPREGSINKVKKKYGIPADKKYVFSLCTLEPRKNLLRMIATFIEFLKKNNISDMVFVLGGGHKNDFLLKLNELIKKFSDCKDKIIKIGYVDDEDLPALYSGAEWFTYTSMYEGFGLPPLEAMSCGCPVIVSNNSSLPEVVGDTGILIDWDSDQQHIEAYEKYYFNPQLRKANRKKGLARAEEFSWEKCVNTMVEVMKRDCELN